jgi:deazaflavin-dependent oxidoreductase (nitroreductase family)
MYAGGHGNETARRWARLWARVFDVGLFPRRWVTLEVPGRKTGRMRAFPLGMADLDGRWYLVSMLGECSWVANVRAAGGDVVLRRRRRRPVHVVEVPAERRGPILRRYVEKVPGGRPHIPVPSGAPVAEFTRIADRYPVFEVCDVPQG